MVNDYQGACRSSRSWCRCRACSSAARSTSPSNALVDHLDAYTAPRLVEYFDEDPCRRRRRELRATAARRRRPQRCEPAPRRWASRSRPQYTVGEYDIVILSAEQSDGLLTWLRQEGYRMPAGAEPVLAGYLAAGMKFFVAKVNLKEQSKLGYSYLRPLQIAFESTQFMLPIRLGTLNAAGPAGAVRLPADPRRPGRGRQLPHDRDPERRRAAAVRRGGVRRASTARCSTRRSRARTCARCSWSTPGT